MCCQAARLFFHFFWHAFFHVVSFLKNVFWSSHKASSGFFLIAKPEKLEKYNTVSYTVPRGSANWRSHKLCNRRTDKSRVLVVAVESPEQRVGWWWWEGGSLLEASLGPPGAS